MIRDTFVDALFQLDAYHRARKSSVVQWKDGWLPCLALTPCLCPWINNAAGAKRTAQDDQSFQPEARTEWRGRFRTITRQLDGHKVRKLWSRFRVMDLPCSPFWGWPGLAHSDRSVGPPCAGSGETRPTSIFTPTSDLAFDNRQHGRTSTWGRWSQSPFQVGKGSTR